MSFAGRGEEMLVRVLRNGKLMAYERKKGVLIYCSNAAEQPSNVL